MYCPRCSTEQISVETSFCSKCGLALDAVTELVAHEGLSADVIRKSKLTRRQRALKQGAYLLIAAVVMLPVSALVVIISGSEWSEIVVPSLVVAIVAFVRVVTALVYDSYVYGGHPDFKPEVIGHRRPAFAGQSQASLTDAARTIYST